MLRHYNRSILLIESNEKFYQRIVNGGPFQVKFFLLMYLTRKSFELAKRKF